MKYLLYPLELLLVVTALYCGHSVESISDTWKSLGFEDKFALRLVLSEPYLYICAGSDGLWRKNIRQNGDYEYLGLADTSLGDYFDYGVQDVLIHPENPNWFIAAFTSDKGSDHSLFRTFDTGNTWAVADSGLQIEVGNEIGYRLIYRLLFYEDYILGAGHGVFLTNNFADNWEDVHAPGGTSGNILEQHPIYKNIVWFGGESPIFSPLLSSSLDGGITWQGFNLPVPVDNAVYSIAFDPVDANIVYIGMQGAMIKTEDGGKTWIVPLVTNRSGGWFRAIESDPRNRNHLWSASGKTIAVTFNSGNTWSEIGAIIDFQVLDMLWDDMTQSMYVATENGIYQFGP